MPAAEGGGPAPRFFLDTNILVYTFSQQDLAKRSVARRLAESEGAWLSTQVLSELAHVLTRRFRVPVPEVKDRIASLSASCEIATVSPAVVLDALRIMGTYGFGFFDSQIVAAALASGATTLYSEDLHHGQAIDGTLRIVSPFSPELAQPGAPYRVRRRVRARGGARAIR